MDSLRKCAISAATALSLSAMATPTLADVIGFEDVVVVGGCCANPAAGYHGFTWGGGGGDGSWVIAAQSVFIFSGIQAHSGENYAWSNGATDLSLSDGTFDFSSMWARIGNLTEGTAVAHGFNGASEIYTQTLNLTDTYQLFTLNFNGITNWTLTNQDNNVLIDDITIGAPVPEPETYAMLLAGLGLLGFAARRRKRNEAPIA